MANLRIGYPEIPALASVTADYDVHPSHPVENLFGGSRWDLCMREEADSGTHRLTFDLGDGAERPADYLAIGRADLLQRDGVTGLELRAHGSDDYDNATSIYAEVSFDTAPLYGPRGEDFYAFFSLSSAFRYWFVEFDSGGNDTLVALSKLYFGRAVDLGHDPEYPMERTRVRGGPYAKAGEIRETLRFRGVTAAKTQTFIDEIERVGDARPVFLMTDSYHQPLGGLRILYAVAQNVETPMILNDQNEIAADFVEVL